jgi:VanZ family protein
MIHFGPLALVVLDCCAPSDFLEPDALGGLLFGVVALAALGLSILQRRNGDAASPRLLPGIALACSIGAILTVTLTPAPRAENDLELVPLIHLVGPTSETRTDLLANIAGNTLLFVPLGAALCVLGLRIRTTILVAGGLAALVEVAQLVVPGRTTSVDDLLLNTLGALLGHLLVGAWLRSRPLTPSAEDVRTES